MILFKKLYHIGHREYNIFLIISGDFDERQFDDGQFHELKFDPLQIWRKVWFDEKNLTKSTIRWNIFDKGQFDEIFEIV